MIETPVKPPPPSGPPEFPPPDGRTRVMDPPPDPGGRHEFACDACGAPLHADQAACLSCGAMVDQSGGSAGLRRAAVGSVTALLVLSGAMGAAVAGLPHGKDIPKPKDGQVIGKNPLPPATTEDNSAGNDTTPLPGADSPSEPPALDSPDPPKADGVPSTGDSSPNSTGTAGGSSSSGDDGDDGDDEGTGKAKKKKHTTTPAPEPTWMRDGASPTGATSWENGRPARDDQLYLAIDDDLGTAFRVREVPLGIVLSDQGRTNAVGLATRGSDEYEAIVYTSNADEPPASLSEWKRSDTARNASHRTLLDLESGARDDRHILIWIGTTDVALAEIKLVQ